MAETNLVEQINMSEKHGMPEVLHVLGHDIRMLGVVYHDVNEQLVDPHVLGDVGAVAVIPEGVYEFLGAFSHAG